MKRFEYDITNHPAEAFTQLVYFCTDQGECRYDEVPADQIAALNGILGDKGAEGWELVQLLFGRGGLMAVWKRET